MSTLTAASLYGVAEAIPPCRADDDGPCPERAATIVVLVAERPVPYQGDTMQALPLCVFHRHTLDVDLLSGAANGVQVISERGVGGRPPVQAH